MSVCVCVEIQLASFDLESSLPDELIGGTGVNSAGVSTGTAGFPTLSYSTAPPSLVVNGGSTDPNQQQLLMSAPGKQTAPATLNKAALAGAVMAKPGDEVLMAGGGAQSVVSSSSLLLSNALAASPMKANSVQTSGSVVQQGSWPSGNGPIPAPGQQLVSRVVPAMRVAGLSQQHRLMHRPIMQPQPSSHMTVRVSALHHY